LLEAARVVVAVEFVLLGRVEELVLAGLPGFVCVGRFFGSVGRGILGSVQRYDFENVFPFLADGRLGESEEDWNGGESPPASQAAVDRTRVV
jgi:hypothetical protein